MVADAKSTLLDYLGRARRAMVFKTEGLSEYDVRRPLTGTGTNLLGLVKHLASVELGYFGDTFGRPSGIALPWHVLSADPNADLFATAEETRADILGLYAKAIAHAEETCAVLDLDTVGHVPWWGDDNEVTLHQVLVHMVAETGRHAGHADILREGLDGAVGRFPADANMDSMTGYDWPAHVARVERAARDAAASASS
ncbi:DinB family protein [Nocardioides mangrovicus]|uniref:DinB family protein n=1 Tax=Nocardioides mangrovicus TaxID=2478913 RepID=A0A3L8P4X9_9ACTN|nr:DinB family protein [Nocardioides mangrovicus]RLV50057.1 DinB family protein [Nocardioides mangrovicus]